MVASAECSLVASATLPLATVIRWKVSYFPFIFPKISSFFPTPPPFFTSGGGGVEIFLFYAIAFSFHKVQKLKCLLRNLLRPLLQNYVVASATLALVIKKRWKVFLLFFIFFINFSKILYFVPPPSLFYFWGGEELFRNFVSKLIGCISNIEAGGRK